MNIKLALGRLGGVQRNPTAGICFPQGVGFPQGGSQKPGFFKKPGFLNSELVWDKFVSFHLSATSALNPPSPENLTKPPPTHPFDPS